MIRLLAPILLVLLSACAAPATDPRAGFVGQPMETINGWRETPDGDIAITVRSNGCTDKDSFDPVLTGSPGQGWSFDIELVRLRPDHCRAYVPDGVELIWTREDLFAPRGGDLNVINPIRR